MEFLQQLFYGFNRWINSPEVLNLLVNNRFFLILLVIVLVRLKYQTYDSMFMTALVNIPGTALHELMHYMVGAILNASPCNFTLFPKRDLNGVYVTGSLAFQNVRFYNAVPSAMAPLLLLFIGFYLNRYFLPTIKLTAVNYILYVLLQTIIIENAVPSGADFRVAFMYPKGVILYGILALIVLSMLLF